MNGHTETVKLLLDRGAKIHANNDDALSWAAWNALGLPSGREPRRAKTHTETVKLLLEKGATITPLYEEK